jgi:hypothetical protein
MGKYHKSLLIENTLGSKVSIVQDDLDRTNGAGILKLLFSLMSHVPPHPCEIDVCEQPRLKNDYPKARMLHNNDIEPSNENIILSQYPRRQYPISHTLPPSG